MKSIFYTSVLLMSVWPRYACGWGAGHDPMTDLAMERLPGSLASFLPAEAKASAVRWSHAPDDFTPWKDYEQKKGVRIGDDDLRLLAQSGLKTPYSLHSPKGQAVNVLLLINSMRRKEPQACAFWMACLLHTFCDEAACNHDPLIHYMTYAFRGGYGMTFPGPGHLDVGDLCRSKEGRALVWKIADQLDVSAPATDRVLLDTMLHGYHANEFMTQRGTRVAQGFSADASAEAIQDSYHALAELGAYGVLSTLGVIEAAWQCAQEGRSPELTKGVLEAFRVEKDAYLAARPLAADSLYTGLLTEAASMEKPAIGVALETSRRMNEAFLGFGGKLISAATMRHLRHRGIPFRGVDVRDLAKEAPDPHLLPVLFICSGRLGHSGLVRSLAAYRERGGRILMVGGAHKGCLGELSEALVEADPAVLPVSAKYGRNNEKIIEHLSVAFEGPFAEALGTVERRFLHNPDTKAGWQKPLCRSRLAESHGADVRPLAAIRLHGKSYSVAAMRLDGDNNPNAVFLPEYLVAPYLLTDSPSFENPAKPALDEVGKGIVDTSLALLAPALTGQAGSVGGQ
ncbi:MAG: hypothetical protein HN742_35160 [Lentisphaerae bacterium]|jgi:hypothetical protein|nr:hypothetical protein [Lentisphaerota bacterium]MBT4819104.1 hypothetical protein [Lentisphaerota bacterium]MBT5609191.1 hypothetical protein [Lentisphaerota bacterium]MBT7055198.1 hypothetical protein [Lentisphaerota bacterium]MBT7847163.1 hypothetical protein [Lentisphaerota bacterium]